MVEIEACQLAKDREVMEANKKKVEEEAEQLKQELQELRAGFILQKKELEGKYQKQVDDMFFFGYRCCMKKHGITQDTPNYPSDDEDKAVSGPARGDGDAARASPFDGQT
ncbi:hypothetical protein PVL29_020918 [Vitis rotundifolia]|uniref:Uncharacterized protein n=1 Tax=Vitis rotundifolia TaxID=103349 RepID=A0AA38YYK9_VITRO|nr:hypothetical protein PVL29_020918 [Vitis rotundifolia]